MTSLIGGSPLVEHSPPSRTTVDTPTTLGSNPGLVTCFSVSNCSSRHCFGSAARFSAAILLATAIDDFDLPAAAIRTTSAGRSSQRRISVIVAVGSGGSGSSTNRRPVFFRNTLAAIDHVIADVTAISSVATGNTYSPSLNHVVSRSSIRNRRDS